jgi:hypothetical protein
MSSFFNFVKRVLDRSRASRITISPSAIVDEALLALDPHRSSAGTQREAMAAGILATATAILGPEWTQDSNAIFESRESPEDAIARPQGSGSERHGARQSNPEDAGAGSARGPGRVSR